MLFLEKKQEEKDFGSFGIWKFILPSHGPMRIASCGISRTVLNPPALQQWKKPLFIFTDIDEKTQFLGTKGREGGTEREEKCLQSRLATQFMTAEGKATADWLQLQSRYVCFTYCRNPGCPNHHWGWVLSINHCYNIRITLEMYMLCLTFSVVRIHALANCIKCLFVVCI